LPGPSQAPNLLPTRWVSLRAAGLLLTAVAMLTGCSTSSATPASSASRSSPAQGGRQVSIALSKCLKKHGVKLPTGQQGGPPTGQPPAGGRPPAGAGSLGDIGKALKACGASFPQGFGPGG
jgi:hypothetical protein